MIENPILMPPVKTRRHIGQAISIRGIMEDVRRADGVNAKIAVFLTNIVGSMWCAYVFAIIALPWIATSAETRRRGHHRLDCPNVPSIGAAIRHHGRTERAERGKRRPFATYL